MAAVANNPTVTRDRTRREGIAQEALITVL